MRLQFDASLATCGSRDRCDKRPVTLFDKVLRVLPNGRRILGVHKVDRNSQCDKHQLNRFSRMRRVRLNDRRIQDADRDDRNRRNRLRQRLNRDQQILEEDRVK